MVNQKHYQSFTHEALVNKFLTIEKKYASIKPDVYRNEKVFAAFLASLDDKYAKYLSTKDFKILYQNEKGKFVGMGARLKKGKHGIIILEVFKNSAAKEVGLMKDDIILTVNGETIQNIPLKKVVQKIRGEKGTVVHFTIQRNQQILPIKLIRKTISSVPFLHYTIDSNNIAQITIYKFMGKLEDQLQSALSTAIQHRAKGILLDLRNNPGGITDKGIGIADYFLPKGKNIIKVQSKDQSLAKTYHSKTDDMSLNLPMVIIVNQRTGSAAEIVAGALQYHQRAILVGVQTYGKCSIQIAKELPAPYGGIKFTIARYLLPSDIAIENVGLQPDIKVENEKKQKKIALDLLLANKYPI